MSSIRWIFISSLLWLALAVDASTCRTDPARCVGTLEDGTFLEAMAEMEVEEEAAEAAMMEVRLLQTNVSTRAVLGEHPFNDQPAASLVGLSADQGSHAEAGAMSGSQPESTTNHIVSLDHNGRVCMMCGRPLPERTGGRNYTEFRLDCGSRSSPTGPTAADLTVAVVGFTKQRGDRQVAHSNGFCELNFAKSCADAVANEDYLYWPKSLDWASEAMQANAPWDARYCHLNGFLEEDIVALQHNFTGMRARGQDLCNTKYAGHGIEHLSILDMMTKSRYDAVDAPTLQEAELLAAWNCAMGDLGCDMAMCAYSFCKRDGGSLGLYGDCAGWDPVEGMPL